jgi:SAM-dependent methyltransferase
VSAYDELSRRNQELCGSSEDLGPCSTTECMRLAVLYPELESWLEAGACRDLVVLGAGCYGDRSPQIQELCALIHGRQDSRPVELTIVDIDARVLEAVQSGVSYDFEQLTWRTFPEGQLKDRMADKLRALDRERAGGDLRYAMRILRYDLTEVDFGESVADLIVSTFVLMYVLPKDPEGAVAYLVRVIRALRPGGRFVLDANTQVEGPLFFYDEDRLADLAGKLSAILGDEVSVHGIGAEGPELFVFRRRPAQA